MRIIKYLILLIVYFSFLFPKKIVKKYQSLINNSSNNSNSSVNYNYKFAILTVHCIDCGLFAFYRFYLGCLTYFIQKEYIPIIDLSSFPNNFNDFNINNSISNPWEIFFNQPYLYTLENVKKYAEHLKYFKCKYYKVPSYKIFNNNFAIEFWHNIALKYIPIKEQFINKADNIFNSLFRGSNNVLGVLTRGTDYTSEKPKDHPIPPSTKMIIQEINVMNQKYKYDWIFLSTEDDIIRNNLINKFKYKLKYYKYNKYIEYNYKDKKRLCFNKVIRGNINYITIYLINIIILSKCLDIITARTNGSIILFILNNKFRNKKIYYLGNYN